MYTPIERYNRCRCWRSSSLIQSRSYQRCSTRTVATLNTLLPYRWSRFTMTTYFWKKKSNIGKVKHDTVNDTLWQRFSLEAVNWRSMAGAREKLSSTAVWNTHFATIAQCWSAHPELVLEALMKKRQSAMSATTRKRRKVAEYVSPNYHFQGMALTYRRPHYASDGDKIIRQTSAAVHLRHKSTLLEDVRTYKIGSYNDT